MQHKKVWYIFFGLVLASLLTPLWVFRDLLFPFITSKAFYFRIAVELALPFYTYLLLVDKSLRPKLSNPLNVAVLFFLAINILTSFTGENVSRSLWGSFERMGGTWYLVHLVLWYFYLQAVGQSGGVYLKRFLQIFISVAVLVTLNGISGWLGGPTVVMDPSLPARVSSTFGNPIFFASYLIIPAFLAVYFALLEENKKLKVLYWIAAILQLVGIYSSGTRGAVVGLIIGILVGFVAYVIFTKHERLRKYGLVAIGIFIVAAGALYSLNEKLPQGSTLYRIANLRDTNTEARLVQWDTALQGAKENKLLGVGPENYYVIFSKFFNPEMYKYDSSWFDKPHNYLLEILVTNGIFGILAYGAMFFFAMYALWRSYKHGLLGLMEMCVMWAALVAYQVQNLFVFDTVSPSVVFYAFMGLCAFLWLESDRPSSVSDSRIKAFVPSHSTAVAVLASLLLIVSYIQYTSNFSSMAAAKRVNMGYAYGSRDPHTAAKYFSAALRVPYNLDPRETANKYSDFAASLVNSPSQGVSEEFIAEQINKALNVQKSITEKTKNDPLLWMRLAVDEMNYAIIRNEDINNSRYAIDQAIALAPMRADLYQLKLQFEGINKDWAEAVRVTKQIVSLNPTNPELQWQVAMALYLNNQVEEAVLEGGRAIAGGMEFNKLQQFAWYITYYKDKKDYATVAPLLEKAVELQPNAIDLYIELASAYAHLGENEKAILLAQQVIQSDPSQKSSMEAFIASLR